MRRVRAGREPGDHVVAMRGRQRRQQQELEPGLARHPDQDVVGLDHDLPAAVLLLRDLPEVLAVVEHVRHGHVVEGVLARLDREQVLGIAQMRLEVGRQRVERLEGAGEGRGVDAEHGVLRVDRVEAHVPLVGVDHDLDRVADVADPALGRLGIRKALGRRVGVLDPDQAPLVDHEVGVAIEDEERRDLADPVLDLAPELDPAVLVQVVRDQKVDVELVPGIDQPLERGVEQHAAVAVVARVDVVVALRIVELAHARVDEPVAQLLLAVVDRGLRHLEPGRGRRAGCPGSPGPAGHLPSCRRRAS